MSALVHLIEGWWWLVFIFGGAVTGTVREAFRVRHRRRLAVITAKAEAAERAAAAAIPAEPQPVCGCGHHLSFHNPRTATCAAEDCRCQQYVGPEPLGHVVALPLVDPERMEGGLA